MCVCLCICVCASVHVGASVCVCVCVRAFHHSSSVLWGPRRRINYLCLPTSASLRRRSEYGKKQRNDSYYVNVAAANLSAFSVPAVKY